MATSELTDEQIFGSSQAVELTDDDVFSTTPTPSPVSAPQVASSKREIPDSPVDKIMKPVRAFVGSGADMMTFGAKNPMTAAGLAAIDKISGDAPDGFTKQYDQRLFQIKGASQKLSDENPIASGAGIATGLVGSAISTPIKQAANIPLWKNIAKTLLSNTAIGTTVGGLSEFANQPGSVDEKLEATGPGMARGAAIGFVAPPIIAGLGKGGISVYDKLAETRRGPLFLQKKTPDEIYGAKADKKIAEQFERDKITPNDARSRLQEMGPEASLADIGGANVLGAGRAAAKFPSEGKDIASSFIIQRNRAAQGRINERINKAFGNNDEFNATINDLMEKRAAAADPLYSEAFKANQNVTSPLLDDILKTPAGKKALSHAAEAMQNDMTWMGVPDKELAEQAKLIGAYPKGGIASGLKLRTWDYIKEGLYSQAEGLKKGGSPDTRMARKVDGLRVQLTKELDRLDTTAKKGKSGFYKQARDSYAGPSQSIEALEMGRKFISEDAEILADDIANLSAQDKKFFQIGVARALRDTNYKTSDGGNAAARVLGNELFRGKLKKAFDNEKEFNAFVKDLRNESRMHGTGAVTLGGSPTAPIIQEQRDILEDGTRGLPMGLNAGNIVDALSGNLGGVAFQATKSMLDRGITKSPELATQIAKRLYTNDPRMNDQTLRAIEQLMTGQPRLSFSDIASQGALAAQPAAYIGQF